MVCCTLLYVHSSIAIILMGKRDLIALLNLSSWCLVMVERLFLTVPRGCLQFVIVVFPDHTHLLFLVRLIHLFFTIGNSILKTNKNNVSSVTIAIFSTFVKHSSFYHSVMLIILLYYTAILKETILFVN